MNSATSVKENLKRILALPYAREFVPNEDGTWFARIVEFPGCMTEGETQQAALRNLEDAMIGWITVHLEDGDPIPSPMTSSAHESIARRTARPAPQQ